MKTPRVEKEQSKDYYEAKVSTGKKNYLNEDTQRIFREFEDRKEKIE